jgi:hypothetical protein
LFAGVPVAFWITKVDNVASNSIVPTIDLLWQNLAQGNISKEMLLPLKNYVNQESSALKDYLILRVLDKSLTFMSA